MNLNAKEYLENYHRGFLGEMTRSPQAALINGYFKFSIKLSHYVMLTVLSRGICNNVVHNLHLTLLLRTLSPNISSLIKVDHIY